MSEFFEDVQITTNFSMMAAESVVDMIRYDGFDNILRIEYGNGTSTDFQYHDFTRSMISANSWAKTSTASSLSSVHQKQFEYNSKGFITSVDAQVNKLMYGTTSDRNYSFDFSYDNFNRLTQADLTENNSSTLAYSVTSNFDEAGRLTAKTSDIVNSTSLISSSAGKEYDYNYSYQSGSHQLNSVTDANISGWHQNYQFNDAGSIEEIQEWNTTTSSYESTVFVRNEDEHLVAVSDPTNGIHHYVYDYNGERIMKSSYLEVSLSIDDQDVGTRANLDPYALYVNEYYVRTNFSDGFQKTKHYYMGMQRIMTDITVQEEAPSEGPSEEQGLKTGSQSDTSSMDATLGESLSEANSIDNPVLSHLVLILNKLGKTEGQDFVKADLVDSPSLSTLFPEYSSDNGSMKVGDYGGEWLCCFESIRYWYHPDYLGSVDMVTDEDGVVYQYFLNNPWGEELNSYTQPQGEFSSPYRFNGKELDEETGLAYYGARYYNNQLTMWLSVDPLAGKYPSYSPYVFTVNNPVRYVDPDGRWIPGVTDEGQVTYTAEEGDNVETLMSQYGVTKEQATEMMDYYYVGEGYTISGDRVKAATGSEIMKLQLKNATGDDMNHQLAFAFTLTDSREENEFNMNDYFAGIEEISNSSAGGTFQGFGTTQNPPQTTEVNWMGKKRTISFSYANKSDERVSIEKARDRNPWVDYKYFEDYNHPDSGGDPIPASPSVTVTVYWRNWKEYAE